MLTSPSPALLSLVLVGLAGEGDVLSLIHI